MMNFSAFGGPFSGIHQFAAKFGHDAQTGAFTTATSGTQDVHGNRYHTNHFNQNTTSVQNSMQYGQNISIPYTQTQTDHNFLNNDQKPKNPNKMERDREEVINQQILHNVNQSWQTLANPGNTVDYSSHLLSASLPITIQHFLKYSETIKKENIVGTTTVNTGNLNLGMDTTGFNIKSDVLNLKNGVGSNLNLSLGGVSGLGGVINNVNGNGGVASGVGSIHNGIITNTATTVTSGLNNNTNNSNGNNNNGGNEANIESSTIVENAPTTTTKTGKKKRKKQPKKFVEKKPRPKPGEIRETKALDGSPLFCCPECQMAYPIRSLIEQHVISHAIERKFVCDICSAALKRKDHLNRHKLSHIPDRPHVCNICLKSFKRKEQLTLHIVIHSGEKKHICIECGKGFYRKDHLRKHTRSHIARRVKSEVSAQTAANNSTTQGATVQTS